MTIQQPYDPVRVTAPLLSRRTPCRTYKMNDGHDESNKIDNDSYDRTLQDKDDNTVTPQSRQQRHRPLHEISHKLHPHLYVKCPYLLLTLSLFTTGSSSQYEPTTRLALRLERQVRKPNISNTLYRYDEDEHKDIPHNNADN